MSSVQAIRETNKTSSCAIWRMACAAILLYCAIVLTANAQTFTTLADFPSSDRTPMSPLVQGLDGNFYGFSLGTSVSDPCENRGCGRMFRITPTGKITILHTFCDTTIACLDGWGPSSLVVADDGNFYGVTFGGGTDFNASCIIIGCGTIFKITPGNVLTTLYNFTCSAPDCADGMNPISLMQSFNSGGGSVYADFYGTTVNTAFRATAQGQVTTLANFCLGPACTQGYAPGTLTQAAGGNFFGTSKEGNSTDNCDNICGAIFRMAPTGTLTTLHTFTVPASPTAPLLLGADGSYYGTAGNAVFAITPQGKFTTVYTFCTQPSCPDGGHPSGITLATDGNFYGATGGSQFNGPSNTLFKLTQSGTPTVLYHFCAQTNCADGSGSSYALVQGTDGKFYGTTADGGGTVCQPSGCGTFFSMDIGLPPFVKFLTSTGPVGKAVQILGQGFTGTTAVSFNGTAATFSVDSDTHLTATVPIAATTGSVTVTTPSGTLTSNVAYRVTQ